MLVGVLEPGGDAMFSAWAPDPEAFFPFDLALAALPAATDSGFRFLSLMVAKGLGGGYR